jgi:hypothetical protein
MGAVHAPFLRRLGGTGVNGVVVCVLSWRHFDMLHCLFTPILSILEIA